MKYEYYNKGNLIEYLKKLKYKTYSKNKIKYINIPAAFDIETSSFYNPDKAACMYIWMMGLNNDYVIYGRTWHEWLQAVYVIAGELQLGADKKLIIFVHNLSYEFNWIRKYFNWERVFAIEKRKPLECYAECGIVFRCSYLLSGESLEQVGNKISVQKKVGQLDYKLIRHSNTPLTDEELEYCIYDVIVVMEYIKQQIELNGGRITKIPLTKTGYVRNYCRKECLPSNSGGWFRYRRLMKNLTITPAEYLLLHAAFQGGFTHACARKSHRVFKNVASYDFTSSYPAVMVLEKFPMSRAYSAVIKTPEELHRYLKMYCCLFRITIYNLDEKLTADHPISASRCDEIEDDILDNGRIVSAGRVTLVMTDVDFRIFEKFYTCDSYTITDFHYYYKGYLPTPFIRSILGLYKDKTELKGVKGKEHDYMLSKELLNSAYGMIVTNIIRDEITYDDEWTVTPVSDVSDKLNKYNESKKRFLYYPWGVWVTAYARYNLFTAIEACGPDYIYADTDSIKLTNADKYKHYFEEYNERILGKIKRSSAHHNLSEELYMPKTIKGDTKVIGQWDYEGTYTRFKTLGAKRYMTEDAEGLSIIVSGINKNTALPYILKYTDPFKAFNNNMYIPPEYTGKNIHTYIDEPIQGEIEDYRGTKCSYNELSCIHLEECDYHLSVAQSYINYLLSIKEETI